MCNSKVQRHQRSKPTAGTASLRIAQREGFARGGNDAASVCGGNDASNMQSLLCTALDAIELKRNNVGEPESRKWWFVFGVAIHGRI
jgi:hypothetical protein